MSALLPTISLASPSLLMRACGVRAFAPRDAARTWWPLPRPGPSLHDAQAPGRRALAA